jgi:hypothetical protein
MLKIHYLLALSIPSATLTSKVVVYSPAEYLHSPLLSLWLRHCLRQKLRITGTGLNFVLPKDMKILSDL